jgi:SAM-dependent methyltransferase
MTATVQSPAAIAQELRRRFDGGDADVADAIKEEAAKYHFYHNIELVPGIVTAGYSWADGFVTRIAEAMQEFDFKGRRVLDIGCRDGAMSFIAEELGASEVIGIDNDLSEGLVKLLIPFKGSKVQAFQCNVNELSVQQFGRFDIVVFPGVLYHLRYPIWALRRIADVLNPGSVLIVEGAFIDAFADLPILFCPIGSDSPYEPTSVAFFNKAGLTDTLLSLGYSDVRHHQSFFEMPDEVAYLKRRFPKYAAEYGDQRLSVCRMIFSCKKGWSDDQRIAPHGPQSILDRYWEGGHAFHSAQSIDRVIP